MVASDDLTLVSLASADLEDAVLLSDEAGWNQTIDDWRIFVEHGRTIGFRAADGRLVASAAALPYATQLGFVSMILVTKCWRRRGLATRLLERCCAHLREVGLTPVLDATPAGATVYRQHGFREMFGLERWEIVDSPARPPAPTASLAETDDIALVSALDAQAVGASRSFLLERFFARRDARAFATPDRRSFVLVRQGRHAGQIGPLVASSADDALALLHHAVAVLKPPMFVDVPDAWTDIRLWLARCGGRIQRPFSRMGLGRSEPFGEPTRLFAAAGPEFG